MGRRGSCGLDAIWKKKKEEQVKEGKEGVEVFRDSKKTIRSPDVEKGIGRGMEEMLRRLMREKLGEVRREIGEVKR